ncbi:MAG TPA: hypothetical protein VGF28_15795 [Thermoanaerobaculia bacterium]|jgi:hypothetical protein
MTSPRAASCQDGDPSSPWELPACSDEAIVNALIEAVERRDRSAIALLQRRYTQAETYAEKHRIAAVLLRQVPDDSPYWNELLEHARNAVRFANDGTEHSAEFVQWCQDRLYEPSHYARMAYIAYARMAEDPRARSLHVEALERGVRSLTQVAIAGLAAVRDLSALPLIERALQRHQEADPTVAWLPFGLAYFGHERADELAFRYLPEESREDYLEARDTRPAW